MSNIRLTGMSSGLDTDAIIKELMNAQQIRVDSVKKDMQYSEWQKEAYRNVISKMTDFQSKYFDVLNPTNNITSSTFFNSYNFSVKSNGTDTNAVTITNGGNISNYNHTINSIDQLATKDSWTGNEGNLTGITSSGFDLSNFKTTLSGADFEMSLAIDGSPKVIRISNSDISAMLSTDDLVSALNSKISSAFGSDFSNIVSNESGEIKMSSPGNTLVALTYNGNVDSFSALGITNGQSSNSYQTKSLNELYGLTNSDLAGFEINGVSIALDETDTISQMVQKINNSSANVKISFDSLNDQFSLQSNKTGSVNNITIEDGSSAEQVFSHLFNAGDVVDGTGAAVGVSRMEGQNAKFQLDGNLISKSDNAFTIDGVSYQLNETTADAIDIKIDGNTEDIVEKIKSLVSDYNDILDYVYKKTSEKKDYDYEPLTEEEKDSMSDEEIEKWEEKAKSGILSGASELESMMIAFRNAIVEPIKDAGVTMNGIGIGSTGYLDRGKLTVDEDKLTKALETNLEGVKALFTQKSEYEYLDTANTKTRYSENGIGNRLKDIINNYVRTSNKDAYSDYEGSRKGLLILKAGVESDTTEFDNVIQDQIDDYQTRIDKLLDDLSDQEAYYYNMFAKMEQAISNMQSQTSALSNLS